MFNFRSTLAWRYTTANLKEKQQMASVKVQRHSGGEITEAMPISNAELFDRCRRLFLADNSFITNQEFAAVVEATLDIELPLHKVPKILTYRSEPSVAIDIKDKVSAKYVKLGYGIKLIPVAAINEIREKFLYAYQHDRLENESDFNSLVAQLADEFGVLEPFVKRLISGTIRTSRCYTDVLPAQMAYHELLCLKTLEEEVT